MERLEDTLRRLKDERDEADRRYNEALTAVDKAYSPSLPLPDAPPPYDEQQITPLNEAWNILPAPPASSGIGGKLRNLIWRTVAPYFQRQLTFNSRLVDHLNRNAVAHREAQRSLQDALSALRAHAAAQAAVPFAAPRAAPAHHAVRRYQGPRHRGRQPGPERVTQRDGRPAVPALGVSGRPRGPV